MTDQPTGDRLVADARRAVHEALVVLPAPEADRVRSLIADLETAVEARTAMRVPVVPVSSPPPDQTAPRDRIAEALDSLKGTVHHLAPKTQQAVQEAVMAALAAAPSPDQALAERIAAAAIRLGHPRWDADDLAAAVLAVLPPPAARAAVLLEVADFLRGLRATGTAATVQDIETELREWSAALRRLAAEAQQPDTETPCGPTPDTCDAEAGEPCANHEREQAHAEGEHCFCGPECSETEPVHKGGNADDCPACIAGGLDTIGAPYECPGPETAASGEEDRVVGYRSPGSHFLYCASHVEELGASWTPVTSADLPDGGLCAKCGVDVLIPQETDHA